MPLENPDWSIELDPRTLTPDWGQVLGAVGVRYASLGVQTFDPALQAAIGRIQPDADLARATQLLRENGISSLNFDLMYGLPGQTLTQLEASLKRTLELGADRIALFGYAHVPHMLPRQRRIDASNLPDQAERFEMARFGYELLTGAGYVPVGFDHFARPGDPMAEAVRRGTLRRNFQGFTDDQGEVLVGLGASAISSLPQGYAQNAASVAQYRRAIEGGGLPTARGVALTAEDRIRRDVISEIMCRLTVDLNEICRAHGAGLDMFADDVARLKPLQEDGVAQIEGTRVTVPEDARHLVRAVGAIFDSRLSRPDRHSSVA